MKKNPTISVVINPARVGYTKVGLNPKELEQFRKIAMRRACICVSKYANDNPAFNDRTKHLRDARAVRYQLVNKAKHGILYVKDVNRKAMVDPKYGNYSYAPFVFSGTGVHGGKGTYDIYPKYAKCLRFWKDGAEIHASHVRHPGSKAYNSMAEALRINRPKIAEIYREELDKMLKSKVLV